MDFAERDKILEEMFETGIYPTADVETWELEGGVYPDLEDPYFVPKLLKKREFLESKQESIAEQMEKLKAEGKDKCRSSEEFELTPVQRFVNRFLNPRTPYRSALLYHGVGVGKTCAAVTVAESFLEIFPEKKIIIVAPPNIQEGFKRTIFDVDGVSFGEETTHMGCTGNTYLDITGTGREKDIQVIEKKVEKAKTDRYEFFGYQSFYNYIRNIIAGVPKAADPTTYRQYVTTTLREKFSNRVLIIDEAHNLRDNPLEAESEGADDAAEQDKSDSQAGKRLTPFLKQVLDAAEDMVLLLMTATPMYNSYLEIIFLLNLLLKNDKYATLNPEDIFNLREEKFVEGGQKLLGRIAGRYVSFMRGENPLTFPLRLFPQSTVAGQMMKVGGGAGPVSDVEKWPLYDPRHTTERPELVRPEIARACMKLPIIQAYHTPESEQIYLKFSKSIVASAGGLQFTNLDKIVMAGNFIFPGDEDDDILDRLGDVGFQQTFTKERRGSIVYYKNQDEEMGATWLHNHDDPEVISLKDTSAKCKVLLDRLATCKGVAFVYSRFVMSGALPIALALEANGYTPWNREIGYLAEGNQDERGRQCALCERKEKGHGVVPASPKEGVREHSFLPAKYVLLTGNPELSPNNARAIRATRAETNLHGEEIKVILGSQIAGEGLDFRYIREVFVFDAWYHLNKLEQIIGRGIRNCSHAAFIGEEEEKRNCTITLLCNRYKSNPRLETIDLYGYRVALSKAETIGRVSRVIKEYAIDCGLNKDAILMTELGTVPQIRDSQGEIRRDHPLKDMDYSPMCDWLENCVYECKVESGEKLELEIPLEEQDASTYDEYTVRAKLSEIKKVFEDFIVRQKQPYLTFDMLEGLPQFSTIPKPLLASILSEMVEQKDLRVKAEDGRVGRIVYKNGYYLFQPDAIHDTSVPIALRTVDVPTPRDRYEPPPAELVAKAEALVAEEDSESFWEEAQAWVEALRAGTAGAGVPVGVTRELEKLKEAEGLMSVQKERLEMILYVYQTIKENTEIRERYADIVLEYIWDEFMTHGTKRNLLMTEWSSDLIEKVAKDAYWELEGNIYLRLLHPNTNAIEYICVDAVAGTVAPCPKAIVEVLKREEVIGGNDPLLKHPIDLRYTGFEYGFLNFNPRKKNLVYKKGKAPRPREKLARGSECAINSGTGYELGVLIKLGKALRGREGTGNDLGMNDASLGSRPIRNSIRVCTVSNLVLRYMDKARTDGKRWFYRPLEAHLYKHPLR